MGIICYNVDKEKGKETKSEKAVNEMKTETKVKPVKTVKCYCGDCRAYVEATQKNFFSPLVCPTNKKHKHVFEVSNMECYECKKEKLVEVGSEAVSEELAIITFWCPSCGHIEREPID